MTALEYIKARIRMCDSMKCVDECPLYGVDCDKRGPKDPYEILDVVESWAHAHPVVTNREKFREVFGIEPTNSIFYGWLYEEYKRKDDNKDDSEGSSEKD
jgi:hypothetical protein